SAQGFYWRRPDEAAVVSTWHRSPEAAGRPIGPVDVREVVAACVEQVRTDQGRSVVVELPAGLPDAYGDAGAVRTIMKHLLGNAVTYSSPERPVVVNGAANRRWVRISVADYGVGMSNDESVRCFEQFWQSRDVELHAERGTGIGLSVVRSLVDAMGGHVVVRSRRGKGATFTVSLPRSQWVVARARGQADVAGLGQGSVIHEFMHQIGVPERKS
ncbi:MAG: HAMP domain-containing histidine kinase, partial [Acidimicrobiia bacterium]|nr:HAMP domain-containing histidine kinase [Acidimicrobiia bacterium]